MKKNILAGVLVFAFTFIALFLALDNRQQTYAKQVYDMDSRFNDINFYTCVRNMVGEKNILSDGVTFKDSALSDLSTLHCDNKGISGTDGLELMTNLLTLTLSVNNISSINLSKNTKLTDLSLATNKLTSINLTKNILLDSVNISENKLTSIDLSKNTKLTSLDLNNNKLATINLSKNKELYSINIHSNQLTSVNLKYNTKLENAFLSNNKLTNIDLSKNTKLTFITLDYNNFTSKPTQCNRIECTFGYIIKFNSNGGSTVKSQNGFYARKPNNPTRNGYRFLGWYKGNTLYNFNTELTGNITLTAKWSQQLAQEEEITTNSNNMLVKTMMIVISLFVGACLGYLAAYVAKPKKTKK